MFLLPSFAFNIIRNCIVRKRWFRPKIQKHLFISKLELFLYHLIEIGWSFLKNISGSIQASIPIAQSTFWGSGIIVANSFIVLLGPTSKMQWHWLSRMLVFTLTRSFKSMQSLTILLDLKTIVPVGAMSSGRYVSPMFVEPIIDRLHHSHPSGSSKGSSSSMHRVRPSVIFS